MRLILSTLILLFLSLDSLHATDARSIQLKKMKEEKRIALVIGNSNYQHLSKLKNPLNDAKAMKEALEVRGFEVIYKENATKREMKKLVKAFGYKLSRGGVGLYFFAGHGINVEGINYLVGVDSLMDDVDEVEYETLSLNYITKKMKDAHNRLNVVILDACRNNPFGRSGAGGLAPIGSAKGMYVAYATEAGSIASDGKNGNNGLFTKHLILAMNEEGADLHRVFKTTRKGVYLESNSKQSPGVYDQTLGEFYFTMPKTTKAETNLHVDITLTSNTVIEAIKKQPKEKKEQKQVIRYLIDASSELMWQNSITLLKTDWYGAMSYCQDLSLNNFSDWRVPSKIELSTLINKNNTPKIREGFKNMHTLDDSMFWSSTEDDGFEELAYFVNYKYANFTSNYKSNKHYVRCVRGK